jgi:hypothetical protein
LAESAATGLPTNQTPTSAESKAHALASVTVVKIVSAMVFRTYASWAADDSQIEIAPVGGSLVTSVV